MNRRQKIIISVTGIFLVLLILVGLTYAYFLTQIQGNEEERSISVTTANLVLEYGDGNGILETDKLEPSNDFLKFKDSQGNPVESKIFTVTNKGNATVEGYKVYLEKVQNQLERKDDLVYILSCKAYTNYGEETQTELETGCNGVSSETTFPSVITSIVSNDIAVGVTHVYELKVKYKEMSVDQSVDMNKLVTAKINIYDSSTKFLVREIMDNALSDETVSYNKTTYINPSLQDGVTYTIPAEQINREDERIITYTMDDYGTSYYFRGNVEDNYVNFADMCWRIVRIEGDGSTKIILEDQDQLCHSKTNLGELNMDGNWDIPASNGTELTIDSNTGEPFRTGNFGYDNSTYSGKFVVSYLNPLNLSERALVNAFKYFQTSLNDKINTIYNKKTIRHLLKNGNWCYNDLAYDDEVGTNIINKEDYYKGLPGKFYYNTYVRLVGKDVKEPTLKCNGTILEKYGDNITNMYVGTLTADEIVFAGGKYNDLNSSYYLLNSYQIDNSLWFWSFSSMNYSTRDDYSFSLDNEGKLNSRTARFNYVSFRPSIFLGTNIEISSGKGTQENPYVIE